MKVTLLKPKISVVNNQTIIYKLPWKLNFSYDEGKSTVRSTVMAMLKVLAVGLNIPLEGITIGIAKCHNNDKFCYDYGKAIAESKAKTKVYKMATDVANTLGYYIDTVASELSADYSKHVLVHANEISHLFEIIKHQDSWLDHRYKVRQQRKTKKSKQ